MKVCATTNLMHKINSCHNYDCEDCCVVVCDAEKPIRNTLDGCNLRRHMLHKRTIRLGTLNVQGIRNKTGEIIKGLEELKQDITILTETKMKGNGVEILGPYLHFSS